MCGALLALTSGAAFAGANSTLNVVVKTPSGAPVANAQVIAIYFNGNPDPLASRVAFTNASGTANFSGANALVDTDFYQIVVSSQGYLPGIVDQYNGGAPGLAANPSVSTPSITITLSSASAAGYGELDGTVSNATPNAIIFGQVSLQTGGGAAVAYGAALTNGAGSATLRVYNVPYSGINSYSIGAFDAVLNRSAGANYGGALNGGTSPALVPGPLDFSVAPPPVAQISQTQQSGAAGGLSVSGVTTDTAAPNGNPIPFVNLNFQGQYTDTYGQTHYDWRGANSDQNGIFQLYGLLPGVTYYASSPGGCGNQNNTCYQGFQSTATPGMAPGVNDFLYSSTVTVLQPRIKLAQLPPSNGRLAVYVKDQFGNFFPQAGIGLWPDYAPWQTVGGGVCTGPYVQNPGFSSLNSNAATGYALITGLPSGNYQLNAWTPYGQASFNAPSSNSSNYQYYNGNCSAPGGPFFRLTIDTAAAPGADVSVYDVKGNVLSGGVGGVTVTVQISTSGTGVVHGTLSFPGVVDLSQSPITIVLYPQCSPGSPCNGGGGFAAFSSANTGPALNYSIAVSSGQSYWMQVLSKYWGAIYPGGNQPQPDLSASTAAVINLQFQPAGRIYGFLRKPDGSVYVPPSSQGAPNVNAESDGAWGNAQVNSDGSFSIGGLIPQTYFMIVNNYSGGDFPYTTKHPITQVSVVANQDTQQDVQMVDAVNIRPNVSLAALPPLAMVTACGNGHGECPPERWSTLALPAGSPFDLATVDAIITGGGNQSNGEFDYVPSTGNNNSNCNISLAAPGFCPGGIAASKSGAAYDFYVLRKGGFDSQNYAGGVRPYFVIESSSKNVIVKPSLAAGVVFSPNGGPNGSTVTVQDIPLTPSPSLAALPQATLKGAVTISNMISQRQFSSLAGNFDGFLAYLPNVWVYDSSGALKAASLVVPFPPAEQTVDPLLKQAVTSGNFIQFQTLMNSNPPSGWGPVGYEIRGLTAGQTYSIVATTPNYPPFKGTVTMGAVNSTTTLNVNFDLNPGAGLAGVVTSTTGAALAGAQVTIKASGFGPATVTTDAAGTWRLDGLGAGLYEVLAGASGYAQQAQNASVSGAGQTVLPTFALSASNASISGTVYTNNPVCPPGSTCTAFGKTVLQGVSVLAYDDTLNAQNPNAVLPLFRAVTNSSGVYKLTGLVTGDALGLHSYKIFVNAPDYYVLNQSTNAVAGALTGFDFALKPKPLDVSVFGHPVSPNYEFQITNYKQFKTGNAWIGLGGTGAFVKATSTDVSNYFTPRPDANGNTQLFLDYPLASLSTGTVYDLHIEATPNDPHAALVVKDVNFGLNLPHNTCQGIDQALIGDETGTNAQGHPLNEVPLDISGGAGGNSTALTLPAGGVIPIFSTATPSMCMSESDSASSPLASTGTVTSTGAFAGNIYTVTLSSVNYTNKGVDLTLSYNQSGADISDLGVYTFDGPSQQWKAVPGLQTLDPVKGTIKVKGLKTLASVLGARRSAGLMAVSDGKGYRPSGILLRPDDTGIFAVLRPSLLTGSFALPNVRLYSFPNPFTLQTKTVALNQTASNNCTGVAVPSMVTNGTIIKYEIPNGVSGHAVIRIFTPSGRLVQTLDQGDLPGNGTCGYTTWDGKNRSGQNVANGVYYGVLTVGGTAVNKGTFKMAVVK